VYIEIRENDDSEIVAIKNNSEKEKAISNFLVLASAKSLRSTTWTISYAEERENESATSTAEESLICLETTK
jgi:hypothetical protein